MDNKTIQRINTLARKAKSEGLTLEEKEEQQALRKEYLKSFRENFISTMDSIVVVDKNGNKNSLKKKRQM